MTKSLKPILERILRLPPQDQHWIFQQLSQEDRVTLEQWGGISAWRNPKQHASEQKSNNQIASHLPTYCLNLATKSPLFIAIILEQGTYPWVRSFLAKFDTDGTIDALLEQHVPDIKPTIKQTIFNDWQTSLSFEAYVDDDHG
jgi:hypothetical protein